MVSVSPCERAKKWHDMLKLEEITMMAWSDLAALSSFWCGPAASGDPLVPWLSSFAVTAGGPEPMPL